MYFNFKPTVKSFTLDKTGSYHQQYRRAFQARDDAGGYESLLAHLKVLSANAGTDDAEDLLYPSATPYSGNFLSTNPVAEKVGIDGGWSAPRFAFELVVEHQSAREMTMRYHVYGHAPLSVVEATGAMNLQTEFTINSIVTTYLSGAPEAKDHEGIHALYSNQGVLYNAAHSMQSSARLYLMRPEEVFAYIDTQFFTMETFDDREIVDTRRILAASPKMFDRDSALASEYTGAILSAHHVIGSHGLLNDDEVLCNEQCQNLVSANPASSDALLATFAAIRGNGQGSHFTLANLLVLDANAVDVIKVRNLRMPALHLAGSGSADDSSGSDITSVTAAAIAQALPALMGNALLKSVQVSTTNLSKIGQVRTTVSGGQTLVPADLSASTVAFTRQLETLMRSLSYQDLMVYALEIDANLGGEFRVRLSVDGQCAKYFVTPAFADAMLAPVLSDNKENANAMGEAFHVLFEMAHDADKGA